ncbi:MAG: N4-gp56 family major capsid protein [Oscillospiraceae bacterium]|jgi:N4-gp56 family major capsid protein|nr:N4-gp56 family major capsid protein [Oscillospiraceae bacterium]
MPEMNLNLSTTEGLLPGQVKKFYSRQLLEEMLPKLLHYENGQKRPLPAHNGKTIAFRKYQGFGAVTTPLGEGTPPDGQALSMTEVTATIAPYGGWTGISDTVSYTQLDPVISDAVKLMSDQAALSIDTLTRDVLHTGLNVRYAGGKTSRATLTDQDALTSEMIRQAVRFLKKVNAPQFIREGSHGYYMAIVGPDTVYQLQSDPDWKAVAEYQAKESIYTGEIGKLYGVVFVETSQAKIFPGAGAAGTDVAGTLIFGRDAYGVVDLSGVGANVETIVKPAGSSGTADPLNQTASVGWKVKGYVAAILQPDWLVRLECGVAA